MNRLGRSIGTAALTWVLVLALAKNAVAQEVSLPSEIAAPRQSYLTCLASKIKTFGPIARTFEHAVYSTFFFCADERVAFTAALTEHSYQDPEGLTKALDLEVVEAFVAVRKAASAEPGK